MKAGKTARMWPTLGSACALLLAALTAAVYRAPEVLAPVDAAALAAGQPLQTYAGVQVFLAITALGGGVGIIAVAIGFGYLARLSTAQVIRLTFTLTTVAVACRVVKALTERARPEAVLWLEPLSAFSFPSAHAASALALYGFIAAHLYARSRSFVLASLPLLIALLVGASRVVLGAHHVSDVIGGFLLAGAVLSAAFLLPIGRWVKRYG